MGISQTKSFILNQLKHEGKLAGEESNLKTPASVRFRDTCISHFAIDPEKCVLFADHRTT